MQHLPQLHFNIYLMGDLSSDASNADEIRKNSNRVLSDIQKQVMFFTHPRFGFNIESPVFKAYITHPGIIAETALQNNFSLHRYSPHLSSELLKNSIQFDMPSTFPLKAEREMANWMFDQCDLALVLWNGGESHQGGLTWELILLANQKHIPVIWIDEEQPDQLFWHENGYSSPYETGGLNNYLHKILGLNVQSDQDAQLETLKELVTQPLTRQKKPFWSGFYGWFIRRFKGKKKTNSPAVFDSLLADEYALPACLEGNRPAIDLLRLYYNQADQAALVLGECYRSSILLRAVLPFIATLMLAVGFYTKNLGSFLISPQIAWGWIATGGFVLQALFNYSVIWLSDRNDQRGWHRNYLSQRYISETLRLAVHFTPLCIPLNTLVIPAYGNKVAENSAIHHILRSILHMTLIAPFRYTDEVKAFFFTRLTEMVQEQSAYHQKSAQRHWRIHKTLSRMAKFFFWLGIGLVVTRAGIQVIMQLYSFGPDVIVNQIKVDDFIISFSNMLALLLPATASVFYTILSMCGFETLYKRNANMAERLQEFEQHIVLEKVRPEVSYEDICRLANQATDLMLGEVTDWYALVTGKRISKT
jgi:hypothetical protein